MNEDYDYIWAVHSFDVETFEFSVPAEFVLMTWSVYKIFLSSTSSCHICRIPTPGALILNHLQEAKTTEKSWSLATDSKFNVICCFNAAVLHPNTHLSDQILAYLRQNSKVYSRCDISWKNWVVNLTSWMSICHFAIWMPQVDCWAVNTNSIPNKLKYY